MEFEVSGGKEDLAGSSSESFGLRSTAVRSADVGYKRGCILNLICENSRLAVEPTETLNERSSRLSVAYRWSASLTLAYRESESTVADRGSAADMCVGIDPNGSAWAVSRVLLEVLVLRYR